MAVNGKLLEGYPYYAVAVLPPYSNADSADAPGRWWGSWMFFYCHTAAQDLDGRGGAQ